MAKGALAYPLAQSRLVCAARTQSRAAIASRSSGVASSPTKNCWKRSSAALSCFSGTRPVRIPDWYAIARWPTAVPTSARVASIAATGFGLAACASATSAAICRRTRSAPAWSTTLNFLLNHVEQVNGFFYHFLDINTGKRVRLSEVSPIDTTILLCGVLTAREYFNNAQITRTGQRHLPPRQLALDAERRHDLRHGLDAGVQVHRRALGHLLRADDDVSAGHRPRRISTFRRRRGMRFRGRRWSSKATARSAAPIRCSCISTRTPGSTSATCATSTPITFRTRRSRPTRTSCSACRCAGAFPITTTTPGVSQRQTRGWAIRPGAARRRLATSMEPWCRARPAVGAVSAEGDDRLPGQSLQPVRLRAWKKYGFVDAFNPRTSWTDVDVLGIDQGITMLMVENYRSGFIWDSSCAATKRSGR